MVQRRNKERLKNIDEYFLAVLFIGRKHFVKKSLK